MKWIIGSNGFGDVNHERLQLSEESMWSGSPDDNDNPEAAAAIPEIRKLLFEGKYREASELTNKTQVCKGLGSDHGNGANVPFGCFQTLGDLWINNGKQAPFTNYYRELDLNEAIVRVHYSQEGVSFEREIFTSQPAQVMVAHFTADKAGQISFSCTLTRPERFITYSENNQLIMSGALADGKGGDGLQYITRLKAINKNGKIRFENDKLIVENADEVTILLSASTDYLLQYPVYKGRDYETITNQNIENAAGKTFKELKEAHKNEYQKYFQRVSFSLDSEVTDTVATDERITGFKQTGSDLH